MKGGVIVDRGSGAAARRYVEADRSRADEYYLGADNAVAEYAVLDSHGEVIATRSLSAEEYEGWVDWTEPITGESMGTPRAAAEGTKGSPLFAEMTINAPKSLSVAAALHPEVSAALDAAQQDALAEIRRWLGQHSVTRVGPRDAREVLPIEQMQVVGITHKTSRAGDPHRHIHMQIGTRVWAAGKWRALDTAALFKQQGAIRAMGAAVIAAHPELAQALSRHGLTLNPVSGEVAELQPFNGVMLKRSAQIRRNLDRLETEWEAAHPGETLGPVMTAKLQGIAWTHQRPGKKPADLKDEQWWVQELADAGYDPAERQRSTVQRPAQVDGLAVQEVASRALDRCAAASSAWTRHSVQEHVTRITTEAGVQAAPAELREFITIATDLAVADCFSVLPPEAATPEHVAHLTNLTVVAAETALRDQLTAVTPEQKLEHPDVTHAARTAGLDEGQAVAAAAVASSDPLVIVEGAAGSGKTTMLRTAIDVSAEHGRASRVVAPTLRAAQVAHDELGVPATSVAALVHAHGWRWNSDGVWTRLTVRDVDPDTGRTYTGPTEEARLSRGERGIGDEAAMFAQDTARALLTITQEAGATVALVGDRAQLPAVGRGGALDMAAQLGGRTYDMTELHRFADAEYASLTLTMRDRENPGELFDRLATMGLVTLHADEEHARDHITDHASVGEAITVASNDEAAALNERIRAARVDRGEVDDTITSTGSDELPIGRGDLIQTRKNDTGLGAANRQQWIVQHVAEDGTVYAHEAPSGRKNLRTVALPPEYVSEHAHLSYAATAYGVQGATVDASNTVLSEATSAAAVYVGMTRGRDTNRLHIITEDMADARAQFIEAMKRDPADRGLDHATAHAVEAVRGIVKNGPIRRVTAELARLDREAERAEQAAERWEQTSYRVDAQRAAHRAETDESTAVLRNAEEEAARVRAEVAAPLTAQAERDGAAYLASAEEERTASTRLAAVGRFGRRKARDEYRTAREQTQVMRDRVRDVWEAEPPRTPSALPEWAAQVAERRAEDDPRVRDVAQAVEVAHAERVATGERHRNERLVLLASEYGSENARAHQYGMRALNPSRNARDARARAALLRAESEEIRGLPVNDAAKLIESKRMERERAQQQAEQRQRQLSSPEPVARQGPDSRPERGIGL